MAQFKTLVDHNLNKNQLLNAVLHTLSSHPSDPRQGQTYYNSADQTVYTYTSSTGWLDLGEIHRTDLTARNVSATGATVIATFTSNTEGHVTDITTRTMTLADLGFTGDSDATAHPSYPETDFTGGNIKIIQSIPITNGHIDGPITTRSLTGNDLGALVIDDGSTTSTLRTWSADKLHQRFTEIDNTISGALVYQGGYDATTNTPNLETPANNAVIQGFTYTVTVGGTFLGNNMEPGDMLIAEIDNPTASGDWTIVNKNIDEVLYATTSVSGKIEIATQAEVDAGTDEVRAVTPRTLSVLSTANENSSVYTAHVGDGTATSWDLLHGLGTKDVMIQVYDDLSTSPNYGEEVGVSKTRLSASTVRIKVNEAIASNELRVLVKRVQTL